VRYEGKTLPVRRISLSPGSDTRDVLREIGLTDGEIDDLVGRRVVQAAAPGSVAVEPSMEAAHG
jgi:hypothetical protein